MTIRLNILRPGDKHPTGFLIRKREHGDVEIVREGAPGVESDRSTVFMGDVLSVEEA